MNGEIEDHINNQPSPQKEICLRLRKIIMDTFPDIIEEKKWGVPTYAYIDRVALEIVFSKK